MSINLDRLRRQVMSNEEAAEVAAAIEAAREALDDAPCHCRIAWDGRDAIECQRCHALSLLPAKEQTHVD